MNFKSTIKAKKEVDWKYTIELEGLYVDPKALEMHRNRVDTIFAKQSEAERAQQLHNIIVRENLFNKAMDHLADFYEIDINQEDVEDLIPRIMQAFGVDSKEKATDIANKIIAKGLIFLDLQKEFSIEVTDQELEQILEQYYTETNQSIHDFKKNKDQWEAARRTLLDEKTTAFIIERFDRDLTKLEENIRKKMAEQMELDKKMQEVELPDEKAKKES
ncbi:hypothetical protein JM47_00130 [Ureaplasma diversum]|uniref:Trigger factor C-terminal domain-containing protein n=2 Tax=Ureaplasma diversum TaxID=42094 RepID=A0A084EZE9_9BACT|nr:hypothetical protein [Ureaplasma diversum]AJQ45086.1 hypothetical protein JM47_00130 [Ureaplasma diversum]KEZ23341.1 Hypothetical protein, putative Trigger factor [Ureaplasma diversum NCTC 246]